MLTALALTLLVEVPLYTVALVGTRLAEWRRAATLGLLVNLLTHPVLWWYLAPRPSATRFWAAEAVVVLVEAGVLAAALRRDRLLLIVVSVGANACSVLMGLLLL
ncbi:hypothetical protein KZZ52_58970 [Dactylosporangium sp. AC04546]|uniref:hypothetical protein n=1 Tax=Dactylosporangium sp. AC04546 TaxID=2862460 RepID=UPI001EDCEDF2|nr:hypothetical protein [Dactylosporangium sp. AC04546]WVK83674.1 hypothetical protein KZZ52_58970 [Dactylosporangium sp. AC04546]